METMGIKLTINGTLGVWSQPTFEIAERADLKIDVDLTAAHDKHGVFDIIFELNGKKKKVSLTSDTSVVLPAEWLLAAGAGELHVHLLQFNRARSIPINVGLYEIDPIILVISSHRGWEGHAVIGEMQEKIKALEAETARQNKIIALIIKSVSATGAAIEINDEGV